MQNYIKWKKIKEVKNEKLNYSNELNWYYPNIEGAICDICKNKIIKK